MDDWQQRAWRASSQESLYRFARWMFLAQRRYKWQQAQHHSAICDALEDVFNGKTTRLILNVPPRYSKTALVQAFIAWSMGKAPDSEYIYTSYSGRLAAASSYAVRGMITEPEYRAIFPHVVLRDDSQAKDEWRTTAGGMMYAVGAGGTITGYGAGKHRDGFAGCFPGVTKVWTELGLVPIGRIVRQQMRIKVWSYDYAGKLELRDVVGWHKNPPNDIWRISFDDGVSVECTRDHRFWTNRGWVRADSLCVEDRLPRVHGGVKPIDNISINSKAARCRFDAFTVFSPGAGGSVIHSEVSTRFGQNGSKVGGASSLPDNGTASGNRLPSFPTPDLADNSYANAISLGKIRAWNSKTVINGKGLFIREDGHGVNLRLAKSSMVLAVANVCASCVITQIVQSVICGITVCVANIKSRWPWPNKRFHNQRVSRSGNDFGAAGKRHMQVPAIISGLFKRFPSEKIRSTVCGIDDNPVLTSDIAPIADGIKPFISGYRKPAFIECIRHDDVTFCLTADEYHNFTIESGIVVKNCILVDDPLKADEARSEVMRGNLIDWYKDTLQSRLNSPNTPIIYIGQRLHENDLAGWLLEGGTGEKWEHVCFPAIQPDGTALWPEKHSIEELRRMEQAMPYTFAGQYMQRPAPTDGGLFKPDRLQVVDALPFGNIEWCRGWDMASTTSGDWTAGAKLGRLADGRFVIADVRRLRVGPDERDAAMLAAASQDGTGVKVSIPQDPGQAGKTQALYMARQFAGFNIHTSAESGNKVTRAEPLAAQINVGNVLMVRGGWNDALIDEMRSFPNGAHDDQIDALSRAFSNFVSPSGLVFA